MEEPKTAEAATEVVTAPPEAAPKPKRKRAPRKPATEKTEEPTVKKARAPKMVHEVVLDGKLIRLSGTDVSLRRMTPKQRAEFGIKEIDGKMGVPCAEPVTITFKSPKAAAAFFGLSFMDEDGENEWIEAGSKADWLSEDIANLMS